MGIGRLSAARVIAGSTAVWLAGLAAACGEPGYATGAGPASDVAVACDRPFDVPPEVAAELGLDPGFYAQHCSAFGVPVLGSKNLSADTLQLATRLTAGVLAPLSGEVRDAIHDRYLRVVVVATTAAETFGSVPELSGVGERELAAAGIGPDPIFPAATMRDSVLVCRPTTRDIGATPPGDTLVHELGHAVLSMGLQQTDGGFRGRLQAAYDAARDQSRWQIELAPEVEASFGAGLASPYLMTNPDEYWAVGVSAWFGFVSIPIGYQLSTSQPGALRVEGLHGRRALAKQDPPLADLLAEVFGADPELAHHCPAWFPDPGR